ncbi:MAG: Hint domain-containing protein, partial [Elusimicrobiota bacterium]
MKRLLLAFLLAAPLSTAWPRAGGGCFPAGTKIATIEGERPIEEIRPGDKVLAFTDGRLVRAEVKNSYEKK